MRIEVLTFAGCPNPQEALDRVRQALDADSRLGGGTPFSGFSIDSRHGHDVEVGAEKREEFGLMCRTYLELGRVKGVPSLRAIQAAIRR